MSRIGAAGNAVLRRRGERARASGVEAVLPEVVEAAFAGMPQDDRRDAYAEIFRTNDPVGYERTHLGMVDADVGDCLGQLKQPTLVVTGARDILVPPQVASAVAGHIPRASFTIIEAAAHFPPFQAPEAFLAAIAPFLTTTKGLGVSSA